WTRCAAPAARCSASRWKSPASANTCRSWTPSAIASACFSRRPVPDDASIVDHHQHLASPEGVKLLNRSLPPISVPAEVASLLRKEFEDAAQDTIGRFVEFVGLKMKATDQAVLKLLDANKLPEVELVKKKMNSDIEQMRGSAQQFGVMQVNRAWDDLAKKKKD